MAAQVGGKELAKNGINSATDLLPLPWDNEATLPTEDEVAQMVEDMKAISNSMK